jgi:hypothetical protein
VPHDKIKAAARKRMAATGEKYTEARRMVVAEREAAKREREALEAPDGADEGAGSKP